MSRFINLHVPHCNSTNVHVPWGICTAPQSCSSMTGFPWCRYVKAADKEIISAIKAMGRLVDNQTFTHSYPFCWRSETPLIYRVTPLASPLSPSLPC